MDKLIEKLLGRLSVRVGKWSFVGAIILVAFHHWGLFELDELFLDILYIYILVNAAAVTPFIYLERKGRPVAETLCPQCKQPLKMVTSYECPECGKLVFKKGD